MDIIKILCYGVRDVEKPFFEELNKKFNFEITCVQEYLNSKETAEMAKGHEAVMLRGNCWANKEALDIYKSLGVQYVLTRTVGVNHIDIPYAKQLGMKMAFVPGYSPNAIAELAVTHAVMLARHMAYTADKAANKYDFTVDSFMFSKEIRKSVVGIIGLGRIGRVTAQIFHGFGAEVIGQDLFPAKGIEGFCKQVEMEELLKRSDIISVHCPYIKENGKVITKEFLSKMKPGAILVNAARGELQDIDATIEAIKSGHLGGCGLDTLDGESEIFFKKFDGKLPNAKLQELIDLYPKVLVSPHIGSYTDEAVSNMVETTYENLKEFIETGDCKNKIK